MGSPLLDNQCIEVKKMLISSINTAKNRKLKSKVFVT